MIKFYRELLMLIMCSFLIGGYLAAIALNERFDKQMQNAVRVNKNLFEIVVGKKSPKKICEL